MWITEDEAVVMFARYCPRQVREVG